MCLVMHCPTHCTSIDCSHVDIGAACLALVIQAETELVVDDGGGVVVVVVVVGGGADAVSNESVKSQGHLRHEIRNG